MEYHNSVTGIFKTLHGSHEMIIRAVCDELGQPDKAGELISMLLDTNFSKVKKKKDPNAPKKPKTGYMKFCAAVREKVREENPDLKGGADILKILGKKWGELSDEEKESYKASD